MIGPQTCATKHLGSRLVYRLCRRIRNLRSTDYSWRSSGSSDCSLRTLWSFQNLAQIVGTTLRGRPCVVEDAPKGPCVAGFNTWGGHGGPPRQLPL